MPRTQAKSSTSAPSAGNRRQGRAPYNLTCANCRNRKVKCDSAQPECRICLAYGERCHYDKPPPMSQVLSMANRIQELEKALKEQQLTHRGISTPISDKDSTLDAQHNSSVTTPQADLAIGGRTSIPSPASHGEAGGPTVRLHGSPHYKSTSAVKEPELEAAEIPTEVLPTTNNPAPTDSLSSVTNIKQLEFWENTAIVGCAAILQLPPDTVAHLLRIHWAWIYPNFLFVSKLAFLRHAATGGPFFSELLLSVICLHATRFTDQALSDSLQARVWLLLGRELHSEPCVPTVQALLHLSAYEVGKGEMSQSWLHSGMAFRMAIDMGLFGSCRKNARRGPVEQAVRNQLAWSCYIWDKVISLYLGRMPVLPDAPSCSPVVAGGVAEDETWHPYDCQVAAGGLKHQMPSHVAFCFANLANLAIIINEILMAIYAKRPPDVNVVHALQQKLDAWRSKSAQSLRVNPDADPENCPPSHVLTQRPFDTNDACRSLCRTAAESVERLLLLYDRCYGLGHAVYSIAYCAYTAATVAVLDLQDGIGDQRQRVDTYLRALYGIRTSCPSIQRSLDIILGTLDKLTVSRNPSTDAVDELQQGQRDDAIPLPTFMFDQNCYSFEDRFQGTEASFGELEPFPASFWEPIGDAFGGFV